MHILCACDHSFLPHTATMLASVMDHSAKVTIHLVCADLSRRSRRTLSDFVTTCGASISFYEVRLKDVEGFRVDKHATIATYFRLLAPGLLPKQLDRVLYLDSDIIVRRSLAELWNLELGDSYLAAAPNPVCEPFVKRIGLRSDKYFNAGVMLMDLGQLRRDAVAQRAIEFTRANPEKVEYWDQCALNAIIDGRWLALSYTWNALQMLFLDRSKQALHVDEVFYQENQKHRNDPHIVHFSSWSKPWHREDQHPFKDLYRKYRRSTPWSFYVETSIKRSMDAVSTHSMS